MTESVNAIVAGSEGFVEALGASLRLRLGASPTVARDPAEALRACGGAELIVVECGSAEWLGAVRDLRTRRDHAACSIVAALPALRMAEAEALRRAGADEAVKWDGRIDPVVWAVDRVVAARARAAPPVAVGEGPEAAPTPASTSTRTATPAPTATPALLAGGPRTEGPTANAAFELREIAVEEAEAGPLLQEIAPGTPEPLPPPPPPLPDELPPHEEVEALLAAWLRSGACAPALEAVTRQVGGSLSEVEKAAFSGEPLAVDPAPLRRGAALRWRVRAVLARANACGGGLDPAASQALPAELDAALEALKAAADAGPAELLASLAAARNALVSVAIELTDALARAQTPDVATADAPPPPRPPAAVVRLLSNETEAHARRRRPLFLWGVAAVALAAGAGYQVNARLNRPAAPPPSIANAPANTVGAVRGSGKFLTSTPGHPVDARELERFKAAEEARGNVVLEVAPGTWIVVSGAEAAASAAQGGAP